jgi:hypothetical protein
VIVRDMIPMQQEAVSIVAFFRAEFQQSKLLLST